MSDFAKNVVKQLKPDYIARCLLESCDKSLYDAYIEDKLLHGLKCKEIDFYKKIIRSQFKQIRLAEKAYLIENNGQIKFNSDHHFILARHVIRPLFYNEVGVYLKIYKDMGMFGSKSKSTQSVYVKPEPSLFIQNEIEMMHNNMHKAMLDNKPMVMISTVPNPVVFNLYCVV